MSVSTLYPNADAYVRNGVYAGTNYGGSKTLYAAGSMVTSSQEDSYIRFNMTQLTGSVSSAVLTIVPSSVTASSSSAYLRVRLVPDSGDGWSESTITWRNAPAASGTAIDVPLTQIKKSVPLQINVASLLSQSFNTNNIATFELDVPQSGKAVQEISFAVHEAASSSTWPSLAVTTQTANQPPTVTSPASASPNPVTGTTTNLSVGATDASGGTDLTYTWATTGTPPAPVVFSTNGNNAAKNTTATFSSYGTYTFAVTITNPYGQAVSSVNVKVNSTASLTVSPNPATVAVGTTQQFAAAVVNQFGQTISSPAVAWSSTIGSISSTGLFTAPLTTGTGTVTATGGGYTATAAVTVILGSPPGIVSPASASPIP